MGRTSAEQSAAEQSSAVLVDLLASRTVEELLAALVRALAPPGERAVIAGWRPALGNQWSAGLLVRGGVAEHQGQGLLAQHWLGLCPVGSDPALPDGVRSAPLNAVADQGVDHLWSPWRYRASRIPDQAGCGLWIWVSRSTANDPLEEARGEVSPWLDLVARLAMDLPIRANGALTPQPRLMAALAEFSAGAGHEINNPLAGILARSRQLLQREADVAARQSLAAIAHQAYRIRDMIADAVLWATPPAPELTPTPLAKILDEAVGRVTTDRPPGELVGVSVERSDQAAGVIVAADALQLTIAIGELVKNAFMAIALAGGQGTLFIEIVARPAEQGVALHVCDDGVGLTELEARHLFDPFFSGRQAGRGLGFGLCKAWQIVRGHGGILECDRDDHQRTRFTVLLPVVSSGGA